MRLVKRRGVRLAMVTPSPSRRCSERSLSWLWRSILAPGLALFFAYLTGICGRPRVILSVFGCGYIYLFRVDLSALRLLLHFSRIMDM